MSESPHTGISEGELAAIDGWCAARFAEFEAEAAYSVFVCEYDDGLPTHSIRSQLLRLVAEVRRLRAVTAAARATLLDAANNDATDGEWARQAHAALIVLTRGESQ